MKKLIEQMREVERAALSGHGSPYPAIVVGAVGVLLLLCLSLAAPPAIAGEKNTFTDECHCDGCHGLARWSAKTDPEMPPYPNDAQPKPITYTTPSAMFKWIAPTEKLNESSPRVHEEEDWYMVKGEVVDVKVEQDGDIHIRLKDVGASEDDGVVGCEIPLPGQNNPEADSTWCSLRNDVFSWTKEKFPFSFESGKKMVLKEHPVVVITGKAFYDVDHAPKERTNVRPGTTNYSVWEIHPVMAIGYPDK